MKKKRNPGKGMLVQNYPKIYRIMRLTALFFIAALMQVSASGFSQNTKLSLSVHNLSIEDVFDRIEDQTEFSFFYNLNEVDLSKRVDVNVQNKQIADVLEDILTETDLTYTLSNKLIIIHKSNDSNLNINAQQNLVVRGTVTNAQGEPVPGVTIVVKGTTTGTITDFDGAYTLSNVPGDGTLIFSFVGMRAKEVEVSGMQTINVTLEEESIGLEEVVAIGYGTAKKANLTGSVATAGAERLENRPIASVGQGLQGVIPNLNITIRNGDPTRTADFNIRGYESINGGSPLILVDGVPMNLDRVNPDDIESITVLKDAAAAAVYGARAAFGVVLVETKRGKQGKVNVTLSTEQSSAVPIYLIEPETDPYKAMVAWNEASMRTDGSNRYDDNYLQGAQNWVNNPTEENAWGVYEGDLRYYGFSNYFDRTITNSAPQQKYNMTISGASDKASYYVSFGYLNKDGWINNDEKNEHFKRYNVLMKTDFSINDWLSLDEQVTFNSQYSDKPHFYNWDVNINSSARVSPFMMIEFPDLPYYLEPGDHEQFEPYIGRYFGSLNFLPYLEDGGRETFTINDLILKQGITLSPLKGLKIRGDFSYQTYHRNFQDVASKVEVIGNTDLTNLLINNGFSGNDWIDNRTNYNQYYVFNTYAEYTMDQFASHYLKAMIGFNQEWGLNQYVRAQANTLITPLITDLNATTGTQQTWGSKNHNSLRGVFYRLNYIYKDKYLFEANGRYDGTSRFPTEDRFGFFPSVSLGWRISNEPFMASTGAWLDNLKFRVSYGELGNQILVDSNNNQIYYPYISTMGTGTSPYMMSGAGRIPYVSAAGLVSPSLTWETVATKNIGFDLMVLDQRLDLSFDYYHRDTKNMLMDVEYPSLLGVAAPKSNAADLRTKGWELSVNWHDRIGQDWQYGIQLALSDNQAEITKYDNPTNAISEYSVGEKLGEIWGYETEGIFQTDEEVAQHADQSQLGSNWRAGDIKYKDLNGDGKINSGNNTLDDPGDRKIIGNTTARYSFGINPDIQYKNWTLNLFFQGLFRDYLPANGNWNAFYPFNAGHIEKYYLSDTWSPENPDAYFAAPHISTNTKKNIQPQSRYVQNAAYVRLKNVTLNYNIPQSLVNKVGISKAQVYFSGMNLWEYTKMRKPLDPEQVATVTQEYYFQRIYTLGVKITF